MRGGGRHVDTFGSDVGAVDIADRDDVHAFVVQEFRGEAADIAETLDRRRRATQTHAEPFGRLAHAEHEAARGGALSTLRPAELRRLARDDARQVIAVMHDIGIEHPAHDLRTRIDVGGGHIAVRTEEIDQLRHIAAGQPLALAVGQFARVDDDAAFRAAHWNANDGALERHPERERFDLVDGDILVKAYSALRGPARHVVLHAERTEGANRAVVHAHRQTHLRDAPRQFDHRDLVFGEVQAARGRVKLLERVRERRRAPFFQ